MFLLNASLPPLMVWTATAILLAGVVDDLRSRKFHNWLFIACLVVALATTFAREGIHGWITASLGFLAAFLFLLPFVLLKILGAGDLKLLAAFGAASNWQITLSVALFSFAWGAIFGVTNVLVRGQHTQLVKNITHLGLARTSTGLQLHRIPYTVAFLLGWLTVLARGGVF